MAVATIIRRASPGLGHGGNAPRAGSAISCRAQNGGTERTHAPFDSPSTDAVSTACERGHRPVERHVRASREHDRPRRQPAVLVGQLDERATVELLPHRDRGQHGHAGVGPEHRLHEVHRAHLDPPRRHEPLAPHVLEEPPVRRAPLPDEQRRLAQARRRHPPRLRPRPARARHQQQRTRPAGDPRDLGVEQRAAREREVHVVVEQQAERVGRVRRPHLHRDAVVRLAERDERRRHEVGAGGHRGREAHPPARAAARRPRGRDAAREHLPCALRVGEERGPGLREHDARGRAASGAARRPPSRARARARWRWAARCGARRPRGSRCVGARPRGTSATGRRSCRDGTRGPAAARVHRRLRFRASRGRLSRVGRAAAGAGRRSRRGPRAEGRSATSRARGRSRRSAAGRGRFRTLRAPCSPPTPSA